ncbi:MAG: electron transport complex subunit E [Oscillospiraceae bacterium]|nr:electron transport complex subunit E [Oscillospiraceae bacterium]
MKTLTAGIIRENPVLVLLLGTCPTLAVSTSATNAIGMGVAATCVLIGSNIVISLLKNIIPDKVRIPCYIVVIAGFVTIVELVLHAFAQDLYSALGIFLPLIVVNCIILGRAEAFANKNGVFDSFLDAVGMGIGFTLALFLIGSIREIIGFGTIFGMPVIGEDFTISILGLAPGGFFVYGLIIAILNKVSNGRAVKRKSFDCESCPSFAACGGQKGECSK